MRTRGVLASWLAALMLVMFGAAGPAPAAVGFEGASTTHAAGMPAAAEPWRTLVQGRLKTETTFDTWTASAQLGGAIPAGETVELTWVAGQETETGCEPVVTLVETTSVASSDNTVSVLRRTFDDDEDETSGPVPTCLEVSIRTQGVLSDLLVGPMAADDAAAAIIGGKASAIEHRAGYPTTTEPWRRLESASFRGDVVSGRFRLSATFGGPVPQDGSYTVGWYLGRQNPTGCEVLAQFAEVDQPLDSSHAMSIERDYEYDDIASEFSCFEVGLFTGDAMSDMLTGQVLPIVADVAVDASPAADEFVVAAGRSTPVIVTASSRVGASQGLTVVGKGRGVRAARTSTGAVAAWRARPVVLRVAAARPGRSRLALTARDARFAVARSTTSWPVVARRLEAQRPRPGRYESADGTVDFRVTRDFVVRGLRVDDVRCEGTASRPTARLGRGVRLLRSGAAARVARSRGPGLGAGFLGAQLLTTSPTRLLGTFTVATRRCTGSARFAAVRQD